MATSLGRRTLAVGLVCSLVAAATGSRHHDASATIEVAQARPVALGVLGDAARFAGQTGQRSAVRHVIISWNQGVEWGTRLPALLVRTHPRVEFLAYFSGSPGSPWDLATKPLSRAAYRKLITPLG